MSYPPHPTTRRPAAVLAASFLAAVLSSAGCSLSTPYVKVDRAKPAGESASVPEGIAYAERTADAYREKLSAQARLSTDGGAALITLASIVLGLAAYDVHRDAIIGGALLGGTGYAVGNWYRNAPHEAVYLGGIQAMSCAVEAIRPLAFTIEGRKSLDRALEALGAALGGLITSASAVREGVPKVTDEKLIAAARTRLLAAESARTKADSALARGRVLQRNADSAGIALVAGVDRIRAAVDAALQQNNPRLESVTAVIGQLSRASAIFAPGLDLSGVLSTALAPVTAEGPHGGPRARSGQETEKTDAAALAAAELRENLARLTGAIARAESATRPVEEQLKRVEEARPIATLKRCGIADAIAAVRLALSTGVVQLVPKTASSHSIVITGGKKPYAGRFLSIPHPGIELRNPILNDSVLEIVATDQTQPGGQYAILVTDAARHTATLQVQVGSQAPPDDGGGGPDKSLDQKVEDAADTLGDTVQIGATEYRVKNAEVVDAEGQKLLRVALSGPGAKPDDDKAKTAIVEALAIRALQIPADRVEIEYDGAQAGPRVNAGGPRTGIHASPTFGPVVSRFGPAKVARIQTALCFGRTATDGKWGPETQARLERWRAHRPGGGGENPASEQGALTASEADALLDAAPADVATSCAARWWH